MTPPLPPGVEGHAIAPTVHTGCAEPDRDSADLIAECARLADQVERLKADRRALDIAVTGLRELETTWANDAKSAGEWSDPAGHAVAEVISECREAVSALLQKIGGTR